MAINESANGPNSIAITGTATGEGATGLYAKGDAVGLRGDGKSWHGVVGFSEGGFGVYGTNTTGGTGVVGESKGWMGVYGKSESTTGGAGVMGEGDPAPGVIGKSTKWIGVYGETAGIENGPAGVWGEHKGAGCGVKEVSKDGVGLAAYSASSEAMHAETKSPGAAAIAVYNLAPNGTGAAVYAKKEGSIGHAGFFDGDVHVTRSVFVEGDVCCVNADCAEEFTVADPQVALPGAVMVISEDGVAVPCTNPYDRRVIGVVSGAGNLRPALLLDRRGGPARRPIALT